jgi:hypothetical protein
MPAADVGPGAEGTVDPGALDTGVVGNGMVDTGEAVDSDSADDGTVDPGSADPGSVAAGSGDVGEGVSDDVVAASAVVAVSTVPGDAGRVDGSVPAQAHSTVATATPSATRIRDDMRRRSADGSARLTIMRPAAWLNGGRNLPGW